MKQVLGMLKAIAGNDNVKIAIVNAGGIPYIIQAVSRHIKQAQVNIWQFVYYWNHIAK